MEYSQITQQANQALRELLEVAGLKAGDLFVVGCSSSEVRGEHIGKGSSMEIAAAILQGIYPELKERGIWLAAQCCEHLNRALILEEEAARAYGYEPVSVLPQSHAGGSWATNCWQAFEHPVAVEHIQAAAGMDIGDTLIGMHLKPVVVPVRVSLRQIGQANLVCARTRPKFIGGARAVYPAGEKR